MSEEFEVGKVVIVGSGQAGTIIDLGAKVCVLLASGDLWYGHIGQIRFPQSQEDLDSCPVDVDRFIGR